MVIRRDSNLGREMDQFQANVQAFEGAEVPRGDGETLRGSWGPPGRWYPDIGGRARGREAWCRRAGERWPGSVPQSPIA
jgi:hypothetical protein